MFSPAYDFDYTWTFTQVHLIVCIAFGVPALIGWFRRWPGWITAAAALVAIWGLAGSLIVHQVIRANRPMDLPTAAFLPDGRGRVLDMGAGSGRSTLMVVRPTALDIYKGTEYGIDDNTPDRLLANAKVAGVADRVDVTVADMRQMPFPDDSFDAAVSAFAIDHLPKDGVERSLAETSRVLRPHGQFLLMTLNVDGWIRFAFPSIHGHGYFGHAPDVAKWRDALTTAGFNVVEVGTQPATLYLLAERKAE
jgi:ubiquinone/menaquinone biosynthesis C-methylase UbiE